MTSVLVSHSTKQISGTVHLNGSKSISNRVLIIRALSGTQFNLENLSTSKDTSTLVELLDDHHDKLEYDAGHAGTTYRFLTAFLALKMGKQILTGSDRMLQRPVGPLVQALNTIGANINYIDKPGFPPLMIESPDELTGGAVSIRGDVSSQFISALLLVAPYLSSGLKLHIEGELVSRPYLMMTVKLMEQFGASISMEDNEIIVKPGRYIAHDFYVEGDWSSASYLFEICSLAEQAKLTVTGLSQTSVQGDSKVLYYFNDLGVQSKFTDQTLHISKLNNFSAPEMLEFNLLEEPDLTQTLVCACAGLGVPSIYSGLKTLKIKETDRTAALRKELQKFSVFFNKLPPRLSGQSEEEYYILSEKIENGEETISIETYDDHRMALAFAPLALIRPINIIDPQVVVKSYPEYWEFLKNIGFTIQYNKSS